MQLWPIMVEKARQQERGADHIAFIVREQRDGCWCSASNIFHTRSQKQGFGMVLPTFGIYFPSLVHPFCRHPQRHTLRSVFMVILNSVELQWRLPVSIMSRASRISIRSIVYITAQAVWNLGVLLGSSFCVIPCAVCLCSVSVIHPSHQPSGLGPFAWND